MKGWRRCIIMSAFEKPSTLARLEPQWNPGRIVSPRLTKRMY
jgi:hypothetical protein